MSNQPLRIYGLVGYPLEHSFSPEFFNKFFKKNRINAEYRLFPLQSIREIQALPFQYQGLMGYNVTIPYKQEIIKILDSLSLDAKKIGAVNVVKIQPACRQGFHLMGFNTDWIAFDRSLNHFLNKDVQTALVLGTGGSAKAVCYALEKRGIKVIRVSRNKDKGDIVFHQLGREMVEQCKLIVNTTPAGMYPATEDMPPFPVKWLDERHFVYDLIYNPEKTLFLQKAEDKGARVKNGLEMLHTQAILSWEIWETKNIFY